MFLGRFPGFSNRRKNAAESYRNKLRAKIEDFKSKSEPEANQDEVADAKSPVYMLFNNDNSNKNAFRKLYKNGLTTEKPIETSTRRRTWKPSRWRYF